MLANPFPPQLIRTFSILDLTNCSLTALTMHRVAAEPGDLALETAYLERCQSVSFQIKALFLLRSL